MPADASPVSNTKRHIILDVLRGFAILGICMANFPEFSLYSFLSSGAKEAMPSYSFDIGTSYILSIFIDGKFYTIFSLLFGIGFSIILSNNASRGINGLPVFYRRMLILAIIGFAHLMLVWSGDILMLYALVGMTLPLCIRLSDRTILKFALFFLFVPVIIDSICEIAALQPSAALVGWQWNYCGKYGITENNFAYWLRDASTYSDVFKFLVQGAFERMSEFVDGNRYFKVLGLFLIGYYIGRNRLYAELNSIQPILKKFALTGLFIGLPLSVVYAWSSINGHPLGNGLHSLLYFLSVYITSFGYIAIICILYTRFKGLKLWTFFAAPGRMALTNYIGQSFIGMLLFYGIGFGLGTTLGISSVELIVLCVYIFEVLFSFLWLSIFRFGPLEWIWRCLTYRKLFPLLK